MSKKQITVDRAREIAKALEEAKSKDSNKRKRSGQYARVRALRRGKTPTFTSLPDVQVGEDEDGAVS